MIFIVKENIMEKLAENETWRKIKNYPGYEVSDLGRVRSLNYRRQGKAKIMVQSENGNGYLFVGMVDKDGHQRKELVHRLVAEAFLDNPQNKQYVDHISTERQDNRKSNLSWVTSKENSRNPITYARTKMAAKKRAENMEQTVYVYSDDLKLITAYTSTSVAAIRTGLSQGNIARCAMGELRRYKGLIYSYKPINDIRERLEVEDSQAEKRLRILRINEKNMKKWLENPENREKSRKRALENYYKKKERVA